MAWIRRIRGLLDCTLVGLLLFTVLLLAQGGEDGKQERLYIRVTQVYDGSSAASFGGSSIHVAWTATLRSTAPAGTKPWEMDDSTADYTCHVSGGGSTTVSEKGQASAKLSFHYKLKPQSQKYPVTLAQITPGNFLIPAADPCGGLGGVEMESDLSPTGNPLASSLDSAMAVFLSGPQVFALAGLDDMYDPQLKMGSPRGQQFYEERSGTFDSNSKSFSRSGQASVSASHSQDGLTATLTHTISYTIGFNQEPEDVEAILIPKKDKNDEPYEGWMPQGGSDEDTPGNAFPVDVELRIKGTQKTPRAKAKSFKFELVDVSKQPGVCLNWPPKDSTKQNPDFDLKIDKDGNPGLKIGKDGQSATSGPDLQASSVTVSTYDWGAWGSLKVTAELDNGQTVTAHLQNQSNVSQLKIPNDDNNNHIADAWEKRNNPPSSDAESDDDDFPHNEGPQGDGDSGDGLSLYEEYRGFMIQGEHVSTSPKQKDVFIHDRHLLGLGSFGASHLAAHLIKENEFSFEKDDDPNPRVINFNHGDFAHLGNEHVIELVDNPVVGGLGVTEGGPDVPKFIRYAAVDRKECLASKYKQLEVQVTIAHELGHATNVAHHGWGNYPVPYAGSHYISPKLCGGPNQSGGTAAAVGGQNSGAQECIMRYYRAQYVESDGGAYCLPTTDANGNPIFLRGTSYGPTQTPGTIFCTSNAGTGMNGRYAPSGTANLGDATRGDCVHQFCVNDPKHKQKRTD